MGQNWCHFADEIFKVILLNENPCIFIPISVKFVPHGPNNNSPALVQIMHWGWTGDKPLSEPKVSLVYQCIYSSLSFDELISVVSWTGMSTWKAQLKLDESTARRQLKSPQSLSGRSIPLVTFEAWSSIDMFAFRCVAIGPLLAEI